ncbi:MAG: type III secretion system outer membrane ring subunit SctC [Desulfovibrionales bacterium]|nr:type III secretion system outer membrane ring subunit SctC [Desulfovibrionales bacterium]
MNTKSAYQLHPTLLSFIFFPCFVLATALYALAGTDHPSGLTKPFTYYADRQDLSVVLMNFARLQGFGASVAPEVQGTMSGRFTNVEPDKFLHGMRSAFGVSWYKLGSTLYFYNEADMTRAFITPRALTAHKLFSMLQQSSVFSSQLPPVLAPNGEMIVVSGPPSYIAQIVGAATAYEEAQISSTVMRVFPLKYAWAEDMAVSSMDKTVTIPGVASILRAMINGSPSSATQVTQNVATVDKLSGTGLAAQGREDESSSKENNTPAPQAGEANIMADPRVNAVLVHDAEYRMDYYAKVIEDLDKPVELVEIHAAIVDIDTNFKRDLGITYQGANPKSKGWGVGGELSTTPETTSPLPVLGATTGQGLSLSTIYTMGSDYFLARIQALEEDGEARMLGRPSVLTVDNVQATLENTTTYYVQVEGYQAVDLFKVEAGTVLRVTPHIIRDDQGFASIKLAVSVQDDQNDDGGTAPTSGTIPPIKQTKINTQAIVGAGQSLLIGGYYYEQKGKSQSGIPLLKDIPGLGHLFKTTSKSSKRMERLILITPKVVRLDELPPMPERVDDPSMRQSPIQSDYSERKPAPKGGCMRHDAPPAQPSAPPGSAESQTAPRPVTDTSL